MIHFMVIECFKKVYFMLNIKNTKCLFGSFTVKSYNRRDIHKISVQSCVPKTQEYRPCLILLLMELLRIYRYACMSHALKTLKNKKEKRSYNTLLERIQEEEEGKKKFC